MAAGSVDTVQIGDVTASDQRFAFRDLKGVRKLSLDVQGILGQEFLRHFDYQIDFRAQRIVFGAIDPGGLRIPLDTIGGRPAIDTGNGRFVIDSGVNAPILYAASVEPSGEMLTAASGMTSGSAARPFRFRAGGRVYSTTAFLARKGSLAEDGLSPAILFRALYVSNSEKFIELDPPRRIR